MECIGFDMDYTLVHYHVMEWEGLAYEYARDYLTKYGFPVDDLEFDPQLACRGLILDREQGNLIKIDRWGYVRRAMHGLAHLSQHEIDAMYGRDRVDLSNSIRFEVLNTSLPSP